MWVPIGVYILFALGVLRPDFLALPPFDFFNPYFWIILAFYVAFPAMVFLLPVAMMFCVLPVRTFPRAVWVVRGLMAWTVLVFVFNAGLSVSGAAQYRSLA